MILHRLSNLKRVNKQIIMLLADYVILVLLSLLLLLMHFNFLFSKINNDLILFSTISPLIAILIFVKFGVYRVIIHYIGFHALWIVAKSVSVYIIIVALVVYMYGVWPSVYLPHVLIGWVLLLFLIGGLRIIARLIFDSSFRSSFSEGSSTSKTKNVLVYGAGDSGVQLISVLAYSLEYKPVGFIDDSKDIQGNSIRGLNVYSIDNINTIIHTLKVVEVLIAMPYISHNARLKIIKELEPYPVLVRILPDASDLVEGKVSASNLREVRIKDLLERDTVEPKVELMRKNISNKVVVVTGAGGSIGSELCRQIMRLKPKKLILYDINELALYNIERDISSANVYPILGSVNNNIRLKSVFKHFSTDTVYHAAAYKHVPMVELNNIEGVYNNVFGTLNCAQEAIDAGVKTFVLISTDKAVRPTNTMGATKRSAELVLQALSVRQSSTKFTMVRFGNVLGSSGSVIPLFKQQIKEGGPVTVTDVNIIRYFMTIPEAVGLVIQAGAMGSGGDVFVLNMGDPVRIDDLAKRMVRLSGLEVKDETHPDGDIEIKYTGLRPGEKLYEELIIGDNASNTDNPLIMRAQENMLSWDELSPILDGLQSAIEDCDQEKLRKFLIQAVPEFKPQCGIVDTLYKNT